MVSATESDWKWNFLMWYRNYYWMRIELFDADQWKYEATKGQNFILHSFFFLSLSLSVPVELVNRVRLQYYNQIYRKQCSLQPVSQWSLGIIVRRHFSCIMFIVHVCAFPGCCSISFESVSIRIFFTIRII